jgi:hypothetical protein
MMQTVFGRVVTTITCRHIGRCRNVDLSSEEHFPVFYPCLKSCALHRESSAGNCKADDLVRILAKGESQDPQFQKEYLKLIHKESTPVMPNEIGKPRQRTSA